MGEQIFTEYEKKVLAILVSNTLSSEKLNETILNAEFIDYEYSGSGYYLSVRHPNLPFNRIVCDKPILMGKAENIECGFVVFLESNVLTIECHSWGELEIPQDFREKNVELREFDESKNDF
jgi:hypothetical protein